MIEFITGLWVIVGRDVDIGGVGRLQVTVCTHYRLLVLCTLQVTGFVHFTG